MNCKDVLSNPLQQILDESNLITLNSGVKIQYGVVVDLAANFQFPDGGQSVEEVKQTTKSVRNLGLPYIFNQFDLVDPDRQKEFINLLNGIYGGI